MEETKKKKSAEKWDFWEHNDKNNTKKENSITFTK